ncbi:MAG: phage tail protein [Methylobacterium sp.]|uniref:hypothetical protein n=1 Tax=Methylobacterium sp. TaxID=409 RepID=UPI0025E6F767|nr:hypothetical protein [Methylobacterium sp.]MBX9934558.1 phage tail protein [Methylobacterium sp.]
MASSSVTLGGITLRGHEVPEKIPFGGKQKLAKHVLIGGRRVTDAMGGDDCDIRWEGRFRGADALSRARSLNEMRKRGARIPLTWGGLYYLVVIEDFEADYRQVFDLPYRIELYVLDDGGGSGGNVGPGLDALVGGDLGSALGLIGLIGSGAVSGTLGGLRDAIGSVPSLPTAAVALIAPIQTAAALAVDVADAAIVEMDNAITSANEPDPALLAGPGFAASLMAQFTALEAQDALLRTRGLVGRVAVNLGTIAG